MELLEALAIFSPDRRYRYLLRRRVGLNDRICLFVCLNPSTATEILDDPTIRRCRSFAAGWDYGILELANIFALRSTNPLPYMEPEIRLAQTTVLTSLLLRKEQICALLPGGTVGSSWLGGRKFYLSCKLRV